MLSMAEFGKGMLQSNQFNIGLYEQDGSFADKSCWVIMRSDDHNHDHDHDHYDDETSSTSLENSISSYESTTSTSSELIDDASSSPSSSDSNGPLYELSELMAQLPIKRGLSKYFQGKSQSFTSLSKVMSIEDLAKKENPFNTRRRMKACKSYAGNLDAHKSSYTLPKATISKKSSSRSSFSSRRSGGFLGTKNNNNNNLPPLPTIQKNF